MKVLKNIGLVLATGLLTYILAGQFGYFYHSIFGLERSLGLGAFFSSNDLANFSAGLFPAFAFFITLLFTAWGDKYKYYWIGVLLLPVLWFVIKFDLAHWYFYLALALVGWAIGWIVNKSVRGSASNN